MACHQFVVPGKVRLLKCAEPGATFLLNSPFGPDEVWDELPRASAAADHQQEAQVLRHRRLRGGRETGMGGRINTIMQTCFFAISGVLPRDEAIDAIKYAIKKTYGKRGEAVVQKNFAAVDETLSHLYEVKVPAQVTATFEMRPAVPAQAPEFVQKFTARVIAGEGDDLPVSAMPSTARSRPAPRSGRSATSRSRFRCGTSRSASSAASACWFARTP